jgi:hypothetical protein
MAKRKIKIPSGKNKAAVELGRLGGLARAAKLTAERRKEIAVKAIAARWSRRVPPPQNLDSPTMPGM